MLAALLTAVFAFTLAYAYLVTLRLRVGRLEERVVAEALSPRLGQPVEQLMDEAPEPGTRAPAGEAARG
jgi:hypothetical protein